MVYEALRERLPGHEVRPLTYYKNLHGISAGQKGARQLAVYLKGLGID